MEKETLTDREVLLLRRKLDLLLRTGKLLMESAADTNRIERNMKRVAAFMGIPEEKLPSGYQMDDDYGECERRDTFLFKISEV